MAKVGIGEKLIIGKAPSHSKKGGIVIRGAGNTLSSFKDGTAPQRAAMLALAEAAHGAYGKYVGKGPMAVAGHVQRTVKSGQGAYGGETSDARRARKHEEAAGRIAAMRNQL